MTDGEAWAREELARLRAARFSPRAQVAFLMASHRRTAETRRTRPMLAAQAHRWEAIGALTWMVLARSGSRSFRRSWRSGLAGWAVTAQMLEWHLGMFESETGEPRPLGTADALTLLRAWLVPLIAADLSPTALMIAAATDGLDGIAARATVPTRAGRDLEGLVDVAVVAVALRAASRLDLLHPAVIRLELARLSAGVALALLVYFSRASAPSARIMRAARWTTPLRVAGLVAAGAGHRRVGSALLGAGSSVSLLLLGRRFWEWSGRSSRTSI